MSSIPIQGMKALAKPPTQKEVDARLKDVSQLYEKQFLREMVKAMRQTVDHGGMTEPSMAENIFREKLDHEYVEEWGKTGGIGLADIIFHQLKERFSGGPMMIPPQGPVPIQKGTKFKLDETKPMGIPITPSEVLPSKTDLTYQIELRDQRDVVSPWDATVIKSFSDSEQNQLVKLQHDNGLVSTLLFSGTGQNLKDGDIVQSGQKLGVVSPDSMKLTWSIVEVEKPS